MGGGEVLWRVKNYLADEKRELTQEPSFPKHTFGGIDSKTDSAQMLDLILEKWKSSISELQNLNDTCKILLPCVVMVTDSEVRACISFRAIILPPTDK